VQSIRVTITGRSMCSDSNFCDNNGGIYIYRVLAVIVTIMTITCRSIDSVKQLL
jgi:hypothetical protein